MKKIKTLLLCALIPLCSCSTLHYKFKTGDTVVVKNAFRSTRFLIVKPLTGNYYGAWDLSTGKYADSLAGRNLKPAITKK